MAGPTMGRSLRFMGEGGCVTEPARQRAVQPGAAARRRPRNAAPRTQSVTAWYSDEEHAAVKEYAAGARLAVAAFVAEASLRPSAWQVGMPPPAAADDADASAASVVLVGPVLDDAPPADEARRMLLLELMGLHRQLRGACTNLNQAVAKLNSLGEPVGELPAIAAYVRRVTSEVDEAVAQVRMRRR